MIPGRAIVIVIIGLTAVFGVALWWAQTRAYYETITLDALTLTGTDGEEITIAPADFTGIDADTSPLRFRGCFTLPEDEVARLTDTAAPYPDAAPLIAPAWFDCYDALTIGADLERGAATGLTGEVEIARGVDRVIALYPDGRGFAWHQLNGTLEE